MLNSQHKILIFQNYVSIVNGEQADYSRTVQSFFVAVNDDYVVLNAHVSFNYFT